MSKTETVKRYFIFLLGLFVSALGVAMVTRAGLGTSPVTSLPYVLSLAFSQISMGTLAAIQNVLLVVAQIAIARRNFPKIQYLQLLVALCFGSFIDLGMWLCTPIQPESYLMQLFWLLVGCVVLGFGLMLQFAGDVLILPGEGLVREINRRWGKNVGTVKTVMDCSMVALAIISSFLLMGGLYGLREGTVIAAFLVGNIVRLFSPLKQRIEAWESGRGGADGLSA